MREWVIQVCDDDLHGCNADRYINLLLIATLHAELNCYIVPSKNDKIKQVKSLVVCWISSKCRENFHGFCFICMESAAIAQSIHRKNFQNSFA